MDLRKALSISLLVPLFLSVACASIHITYPKDVIYTEIEKVAAQHGEPNYLKGAVYGDVAPGQTLRVIVSRASGTPFIWDNLVLKVPKDWQKTGKKEANNFLFDIVVPQDAKSGEYTITLNASGDIQVLTPNIIDLKINVRTDLYSFTADPSYQLYIDTSNSIPFSIKSESLAIDTVYLTIEGIAAGWTEPKRIIMSPNEEKRTFFVVNPRSEGVYPVTFRVSSPAGGIAGSKETIFFVNPPSVKSKLEVLNEGFSIVTVVLQPFYSLLSLIGSVL